MKKAPNEIALELNNGMTIKGPTEAWVLGILSILTSEQLTAVIQYLDANRTTPASPGDLHTPDGRRVHFMSGNGQDDSDR